MESIQNIMPRPIQQMLQNIDTNSQEKLEEIRFRIGKPIIIRMTHAEYGLKDSGLDKVEMGYRLTRIDMENIMKLLSGFSLYALEDELRQGYLTLKGGHRVGIAGKVVVEKGNIKTIKNISAINIRIAHQVIGCSKTVMPYLLSREKVYHTLIVSPPKCGKTTLLRDIVRNLSNGYSGYGPYTVGVVDERSEIGGCYEGVPQNDVGIRTDILDGCPKSEGMRMLLRAMGPEVIAVDEIGKSEDIRAIEEVLSAGITVISSVHAKNLEDCKKIPGLNRLLDEGRFERMIILSNEKGPCTIQAILDGTRNFKVLY